MLYRFTSRSVADLIMLPTHAEHMLKIMGKEPTPQGIIVALEIPLAVAALQAAADVDEQAETQRQEARKADQNRLEVESSSATEEDVEHVSLKRRAAPLLDMLMRSAESNHDVMWSR